MNSELKPGWSIKQLSDVANIVSGGTPSREIYEFWNPADIAWITPTDITRGNSRALSESKEKISRLGLKRCSAKLLPIGTVLMTSRATLGEMKVSLIKCCTNQGFKSLVPKKETDTWFLYYQMLLNKPRYESLGIGSTFLEVNKKDTDAFLVPFPELPQQKKIAKILTTVDNLIEQTQALIDKYTAIKQGMMADLFTRGIDLSGTPETNPNHGQLRPSVEQAPELYKETELGWVPKEWEIVTLQDVARVERGKFTHRPRDDSKCYGGSYPFIQTGSVTKANGGFIRTYSQTLSEFGKSVSKEFPVGTIAVTIAANIADTAILDLPMCFPDSIVGVVVNDTDAEVRFIEAVIRLAKPRLDALAPLSAQKNINLEDLRPLKIPLPSAQEQQKICETYNSTQKYIDTNTLKVEKLKKQKKGLMQDLLTGKVQVNA